MMQLVNGIVSRMDGKPFKGFRVKITPDSAPRDRVYPSLTRVGAGWQIYAPYLQIKNRLIKIQLSLPSGWTLAPKWDSAADLQGQGFIGPRDYVRRGAVTTVVAPELSTSLQAFVVDAATKSAAQYSERLNLSIPNSPTIIVAQIPEFRAGWRGDTMPGSVISLRFFGGSDHAHDRAWVARFVYHEVFHLWNAQLATSRDLAGEAWLHEGMAEYAALTASEKDGFIDEADIRQELGDHLTGCEQALGDASLEDGVGVRLVQIVALSRRTVGGPGSAVVL